RRPVRSIIVRRSAGSRSTRIVSMSVTPLAFRKRKAWMQYGHTAVEYIVTFGNSLLHRQSGILPRLVSAAKVVDVLESQPSEHTVRHPRTVARHVVRDDGLARMAGELAAA